MDVYTAIWCHGNICGQGEKLSKTPGQMWMARSYPDGHACLLWMTMCVV